MRAGEGTPALGQRFKEEPQINRMERAGMIPAGDVRVEIVRVKRRRIDELFIHARSAADGQSDGVHAAVPRDGFLRGGGRKAGEEARFVSGEAFAGERGKRLRAVCRGRFGKFIGSLSKEQGAVNPVRMQEPVGA